MRILSIVLVVLLAGLAAAQDIEIHIMRQCDGEPLSEIVMFISMLGSMEVEIEEGIKDRPVHCTLEHEVHEALGVLAKAVGAHLWKLPGGKYAIRSRPQGEPGEQMPEVPAGPPPPPWKAKILEALAETKVPVAFDRVPLPDLLAFLARKAGVVIRVDPVFVKSQDLADLKIDLKDIEGGEQPVGEVLEKGLATCQLAFDIRWGVVFVATPARLEALPETLLPEPSGEPAGTEKEIRDKLAASKLTLELKRRTLRQVVSTLGREGGLKLEIDRAAFKGMTKRDVEVDLCDRTLGHALALVLLPRGIKASLTEKGLRIERGGK